eukprot:gene7671-8478_t
MSGLLTLLGQYGSDEEEPSPSRHSSPVKEESGVAREERMEEEEEPLPAAPETSSSSSPAGQGGSLEDRWQRMRKISFDLHELDDPSALRRFLQDFRIDERGSLATSLLDREAPSEQFQQFVRGELSCEALAAASATTSTTTVTTTATVNKLST